MARKDLDYDAYDPETGVDDYKPVPPHGITARMAFATRSRERLWNDYNGPIQCADCYSKKTLLPVLRATKDGEVTVLLCQVCRHTGTIED